MEPVSLMAARRRIDLRLGRIHFWSASVTWLVFGLLGLGTLEAITAEADMHVSLVRTALIALGVALLMRAPLRRLLEHPPVLHPRQRRALHAVAGYVFALAGVNLVVFFVRNL
jgi:hypothetical protein